MNRHVLDIALDELSIGELAGHSASACQVRSNGVCYCPASAPV